MGDRFLRCMVCILVATALREVMDCIALDPSCAEEGGSWWLEEKRRLLNLIRRGKREDTTKAAPPYGLFFVGATFHS